MAGNDTVSVESGQRSRRPQRTYYEILGVDQDADAATLEVAYHGRSLRFGLNFFGDRPPDPDVPTRSEVEGAYAVLRDPDARSRYDARLFSGRPETAVVPPRRRVRWLPPRWVWAILLVWTMVVGVVVAINWRSYSALVMASPTPAGDPIGRILANNGFLQATRGASVTSPTATPPSGVLGQAEPDPALATPSPPPPTPMTAAPTPTIATPTPTTAPTATATAMATPTPSPTATATQPATIPPGSPSPVASPVVVAASPAGQLPTLFLPTDRIESDLPVNLRAGPGTAYAAQGALPPGTLLAATGQSAVTDGVRWREYRLQDGRTGWVVDSYVEPAPSVIPGFPARP